MVRRDQVALQILTLILIRAELVLIMAERRRTTRVRENAAGSLRSG